MADLLEYERKLWKDGYEFVAGVDEAGRGPLAGPVYAAAVIFPKDVVIDGINEAEKMNVAAQNALLKTLEEPP